MRGWTLNVPPLYIYSLSPSFYPRARREGTPTVPSSAPSHHTTRSRLVRSQASLGFYISPVLSHLVLLCSPLSTQRRPSPLRSLKKRQNCSRHQFLNSPSAKRHLPSDSSNPRLTDTASTTSSFNTPTRIPHLEASLHSILHPELRRQDGAGDETLRPVGYQAHRNPGGDQEGLPVSAPHHRRTTHPTCPPPNTESIPAHC